MNYHIFYSYASLSMYLISEAFLSPNVLTVSGGLFTGCHDAWQVECYPGNEDCKLNECYKNEYQLASEVSQLKANRWPIFGIVGQRPVLRLKDNIYVGVLIGGRRTIAQLRHGQVQLRWQPSTVSSSSSWLLRGEQKLLLLAAARGTGSRFIAQEPIILLLDGGSGVRRRWLAVVPQ